MTNLCFFTMSPGVVWRAGGIATIAGAVVIGLARPAVTRYRRQPHPSPVTGLARNRGNISLLMRVA